MASMATKSVDVGDMFLMDLTDSLDESDLISEPLHKAASYAKSAAVASPATQSHHNNHHHQRQQLRHSARLQLLSQTNQQASFHQALATADGTQFNNDLQSLSQIHSNDHHTHQHLRQPMAGDMLMHAQRGASLDKLATISMPNFGAPYQQHRHTNFYHQEKMQHTQKQQLIWTPHGPSVVEADSTTNTLVPSELTSFNGIAEAATPLVATESAVASVMSSSSSPAPAPAPAAAAAAAEATAETAAAAKASTMNADVILEDSGFMDKLDDANIFVEASTPTSSSSETSNLSDKASSTNLSDDIVSVASSSACNDDDELADQRGFARVEPDFGQRLKPLPSNTTETNLISSSNTGSTPDGHLNTRRGNVSANKQYLNAASTSTAGAQAVAAAAAMRTARANLLSASLPIEVPTVRRNMKLRKASDLRTAAPILEKKDADTSGRGKQFLASSSVAAAAAALTSSANSSSSTLNYNLVTNSAGSSSVHSTTPGAGKSSFREAISSSAQLSKLLNAQHARSSAGNGRSLLFGHLYELDEDERLDSSARGGCNNENHTQENDTTSASHDDFGDDDDEYDSNHNCNHNNDDDVLSEDDMAAIRENPIKILKNIEALARSVHDDTNEVFGSLPRRQFNTGELVRSLRLA